MKSKASLAHAEEVNVDWLLVIMGFLCGSIPFGYCAGRLKGIDIRQTGSGNIGATNVFRALGKKWGIGVLLADIIKGYFPVWMALRTENVGIPHDAFVVCVGMAALLGHTFTPFLKFKGGKGVATSTGALLAMMPLALGITAIVWGMMLAIFRYVSLASIFAAIVLPILAALFYREQMWFVGVGAVMGILVIVRHRANIQRLLAGTENRLGKKP
ncbi:MAG: glycerol-3-phosphate 1-O-acyltransferase PlsY [Verrucomicrobiota bacterium]